MNSADANKPIVVKRVKKYAAGAHGGAWKVAFADFVTAMMALFLVLWLIESTTPAEKMAISMYFTDPTGYVDGGSPFVINLGGGMRNTDTIDKKSSPAPATQEPDVNPDKNLQPNMSAEQVEELHQQKETQKFEQLKKMLEERIEADPTLGALKDQIIIKITEEGLMIEVVDKDKRPMFDSGGAVIKPYMRTILKEISKTLHDVPNKLSVSGHTDAVPFTEVENYTNWELSADRANAARRAMLAAGIKESQISRVVGLADSQLYDAKKPENPINRRISILAMRTPPEPVAPPPAVKEGGDAPASGGGFPGGVQPGGVQPGGVQPGGVQPGGVQPGVAPAGPTGAAPVTPDLPADLPPDADFPGGFGAPNTVAPPATAVPSAATVPATSLPGNGTAAPVTGSLPGAALAPVPGNLPQVPAGMTPRPVLPSGNNGAAAITSPVGGSIAPVSGSVIPKPGDAFQSAPVAAPQTRAPQTIAPPPGFVNSSAPASVAPATAAPIVPNAVPRATNADDEFF